MNQPINKPLRVTTLGMDNQTRKILEMVFNGPGRGDYLLVERTDEAETTIFDLDGLDAMKLWAGYRASYSQLPTVVLSLNQKDIAGTFFVKKPIEIEKLLKALSKAKQLHQEQKLKTVEALAPVQAQGEQLTQSTRQSKLNTELNLEAEEEVLHQFCGYMADINPKNPAEVEKVYYEPEKYLQGFFEKAFSVAQQLQTGGVSIEGLYTPMILYPEKNQLLCGCDATENQLRTMTLLPLASNSHLRLITLSHSEVQQRQVAGKLTMQPLDNFLWKVALWTARGKIPKGTDLTKDVVLIHWPNFTHLIVTPHALEISALWIAHPHSLLDTAKVLEIPQRYVFSFFSAACAIKLAFIDRRLEKRARQALNPNGSDKNKRGLFQRILARLRGQE